MDVTCSHCGARIESDAKACGYCGMPIKRSAGPSPTPRVIHRPVDEVKWGERIECAKCGRENAADARYCTRCGASLKPALVSQASDGPADAPTLGTRIECAKCGTESAASARYCNHCGAALGPTSVHTKVTRSPQASPVAAEAPLTRSGVGRRGPRLGCGIGAGLMVAILVLAGQTLSSGRVSGDAVPDFVFNLAFFGCIATAAGYARAGQWKKAGYAVLALTGFLVLWFAGWWGLPLLLGR